LVRLDREAAERERIAALKREKSDAEAKAGKARYFWTKECDPLWWLHSPVWTYLTEARGLPLTRMAAAPGAIRLHPNLEHYDQATGEVTSWPAMCTAISGPEGDVTGVHITWLAAGGLGKAPVDPAKKMRGVAKGGAIRLSKGGSRLTPEEAGRRGLSGPLILTEGIEDGLTAALARPSERVWAAGSLSLLGELKWPKCASSVVLVADNDWLKPAAISAFEAVERKWRDMAEGRPLKVVRADVGKDLNDWARGAA
jgi:Toprim domain